MMTATKYGKVTLVGAGPGAADLITLRGARILARADVVLYDALVTKEMLALCPYAIRIAVGKRCGKHSATQREISQKLIECAQKYRQVVRLKGGDPMIFGRADEELRALEAHGIEVEVVPGITAALAAAAATRQPLTVRGVARSVAFFTLASANPGSAAIDIPGCDTIVQYMGGSEAATTATRLLARGRSPQTPVIIVENCSLPNQRIVHATLSELQRNTPDFSGPVLVMIGEALARRNRANDMAEALAEIA